MTDKSTDKFFCAFVYSPCSFPSTLYKSLPSTHLSGKPADNQARHILRNTWCDKEQKREKAYYTQAVENNEPYMNNLYHCSSLIYILRL